ncbi:hypothetical protein [Fodinicola feengrottensis]|uniref:DUF5666 domain-containing protein n=1 Tax=Fodinicola feengrottensis TaxID=435914 RepID=A0ABN2FZD2_9ACTN|nr:hypothetical protein [Fodinicola feengrottensis]
MKRHVATLGAIAAVAVGVAGFTGVTATASSAAVVSPSYASAPTKPKPHTASINGVIVGIKIGRNREMVTLRTTRGLVHVVVTNKTRIATPTGRHARLRVGEKVTVTGIAILHTQTISATAVIVH